eukprot:1579588-Amphidinium_carterae.1
MEGTAPGEEADPASKVEDQTSSYYSDAQSSPIWKVPTPLWKVTHPGGDTSVAESCCTTLCWGRAPTERLRRSYLSRRLRRGALRPHAPQCRFSFGDTKSLLQSTCPPPKTCPFSRGLLFGSEQASDESGAVCVVWSDRHYSKGERSEDPSPLCVLPGERFGSQGNA